MATPMFMDTALYHVQNRKAIPFVVYCFRNHYDTHRLTQKMNRWNDRKLRKNLVPANSWNRNRSNERYACVPEAYARKNNILLIEKSELVLKQCFESP